MQYSFITNWRSKQPVSFDTFFLLELERFKPTFLFHITDERKARASCSWIDRFRLKCWKMEGKDKWWVELWRSYYTDQSLVQEDSRGEISGWDRESWKVGLSRSVSSQLRARTIGCRNGKFLSVSFVLLYS